MTYLITSDEYLELSYVPLMTPAWCHGNLWELWSDADQRGDDVPIPHADGMQAQRRYITKTEVPLELAIFGDFDWEGNRYSDYRVGLRANCRHLKQNVTRPTGTGNGTRPAILHEPGMVQSIGPVHVGPLKLGGDLGASATRAVIRISIPAGELVEVGP